VTLSQFRQTRPISVVLKSSGAPSSAVEFTYYALVLYAILGTAWGISINLLGAGALALLAMLCLEAAGSRRSKIYAPITLLLCCAISFIAVQVVFHDEEIMGPAVRPFVTWILGLIIVRSLLLRQGFLHRFAIAAFFIGLCVLPYLQYQSESGIDRAGLDRAVTLGNPNDLAAWFGFCAVYFAIVGIETKRNAARVVSWILACGCLFVVGLTVSRGALAAVAFSLAIALRHVLKRGFVPALVLIVFAWGLYVSGAFESATASYIDRGDEESGRFLVWPLAIERFIDSPLTGVGDSHIATDVPGRTPITPHNTLIYLGLASGVLPLVFFLCYLLLAAQSALRSSTQPSLEAPFRVPLLSYAFAISMIGQAGFLSPWCIVTFISAVTSRSAVAGPGRAAPHIRARPSAIRATSR
jgi:O-antigen ligase